MNNKVMKTKKEFCVHVTTRKDYENIYAINPKEAERLVIDAEYTTDINYDDINAEVMRVHCSTDHDLSETRCQVCNKKL
jgi:hypothetical protein